MFSAFRARLLPLLRLRPEPAPPWGAPGSARVFRAGRNFYRLRLFVWSAGQLATLAGLVVSLGFLAKLKHDVDRFKSEPRPAAIRSAQSATDRATGLAPASSPARTPKSGASRKPPRPDPQKQFEDAARGLAERAPWWLFPAIGLFEIGGLLLYLAQIPVTYAIVRLEFEQRWYIVTDRSLRIRSGLVSVQETTMSFANVQQVAVSQGPLQRLLGIADVRVRSAGGGSGAEHSKGRNDSMHAGDFHGVDNAPEIRDLILERLREFRAAGLGDPDDHGETGVPQTGRTGASAAGAADALSAARELLAEARALRASFTPPV